MTNHITCCMSIIIWKRMGMGWFKSYPQQLHLNHSIVHPDKL